MKKILSAALTCALLLLALSAFAGCSSAGITIAIPNDPTNEARALQLLEKQGLIKLSNDAGTLATVRDISENPYNITFREVEAAQLPQYLADLDYAVINSNYAISAGITPILTEGTDVSYPNILAVKSGNENSAKIKALVAAVNSQAVVDFIRTEYSGAVVCDLTNVTADGIDPSVDYAALAGQTIKVAASPTPHADILKKAKDILATKNITLEIVEFTDYIQPNEVVESGECDANYFQHIPYLTDFNAQKGTHLVSVLAVHHEPMGIYSSKHTTLDDIKNK